MNNENPNMKGINESNNQDRAYANRPRRKRKALLSRGKKIAISVILVIYAFVIVATSLVVFYRPTVRRSTIQHIVEITNEKGEVIGTEIVEYEPEDKPTSYNVLVLGMDRMAMLTDVFMIVNIDTSDNSITVMQIPRDTWVSNHSIKTEEGDIRPYDVISNKANAIFSTYFRSNLYGLGMSEDEAYDAALETLTETIENSLLIHIDYSVIMDLNGFRNIVDTMGGVEIYIPSPMVYYDDVQGLAINIPAGVQTLNGEQSEGFVRYRIGYLTADLGRQNAQKRFLVAMFNKLKSTCSLSNISQLTEIADSIFTYVDTNMSAGDILFFAQCLLKCDLESMNMLTMPGNLADGYYVMNHEAVLNLMNAKYSTLKEDIRPENFDNVVVDSGSGIKYQLFNNPLNYNINNVYNQSPEYVYDNSIYNGEEVDENGIDIPLAGY